MSIYLYSSLELKDCVLFFFYSFFPAYNDWIYALMPSGRKYKRICKGIHEFSRNIIAERRKQLESNEVKTPNSQWLYALIMVCDWCSLNVARNVHCSGFTQINGKASIMNVCAVECVPRSSVPLLKWNVHVINYLWSQLINMMASWHVASWLQIENYTSCVY